MAVDSAGNAYVADLKNATIRKVTAGGVVTTLAGTANMPGSADGTGTSARFAHPVPRGGRQCRQCLRRGRRERHHPEGYRRGVVTTVAGAGGIRGSVDGTGAAARFALPSGVAVDSAGNVYVADVGNATIRKVTPGGVVTTVAGTAGVAGIALGGSPRFAFPAALAIVGDSLVITDTNAVLLLRHGAR